MTRLSCRVATGALALRFCREDFNSGDFFLAIFHLSRRKLEGGYTCDFHLAQPTRQNSRNSHHLCELKGGRVGVVVRALASHQCDLG